MFLGTLPLCPTIVLPVKRRRTHNYMNNSTINIHASAPTSKCKAGKSNLGWPLPRIEAGWWWRHGGWCVGANQVGGSPTSPVKSWWPRPAIKLSHWPSRAEARDQAASLAEGRTGEVWLVSGWRGQGSQLGGGWPEGQWAVARDQREQPVGLSNTC